MRAVFQLAIVCMDAKTAKKLLEVLEPDNRAFPKTQRFTSERKGRRLIFLVESNRTMSLLSTLESILADVGLFQDVWSLATA